MILLVIQLFRFLVGVVPRPTPAVRAEASAMRFDRSLRRRLGMALLLAFAGPLAASSSQPVSAAQASATEETTPSESIGAELGELAGPVVVGIRGHYRVGRQTAVRLARPSLLPRGNTPLAEHRTDLQMMTLDGDGVRVIYDTFPIESGEVPANGELGYVVPGSEAAPLQLLRQHDGGSETIYKGRFPEAGVPARGPSMIPPEMPWVVSIGDPLGVDEIGTSTVLRDKQATIAVTRVDSADSLPWRSFGYEGVDLVMINASGLPVLRSMSGEQSEALLNWLRGGGRIFLALGQSAPEVDQAAPWLTGVLPVEQVELSQLDPAALETFTSSQTPLQRFEGIRLPRRTGRTLITGRTTRRVTAVLAAEYLIGFGRLTVIAADLDSALFASWPDRLSLVKQLAEQVLVESERQSPAGDRATSFNDLAGQVRGTLDQFSLKPSFSFSFISVILLALIAAIGPLDYLLINRVFGRPLLGWLTFPLVAIALSVFLVFAASPRNISANSGADANQERSALAGGAEPSTPQASGGAPLLRANQLQIVDVDWVNGFGRAFAWAYLYSHGPADVDVSYRPSADLIAMQRRDDLVPRILAFPMGYPGRSFGGIQLAGEDSLLPPYTIDPQRFDGDEARDASGEQIATEVRGLTIAPRSSKSVAMESIFTPEVDTSAEVIRRPGSELLRGGVVNPLPMDVLDGMLIYRNWVYLLPTRFPAGAEIPSLGDLRQKNFRWRLSRQQALEENVTETTPWEVGDFSNLDRVAEMVMFHRAAGGELYTGLRHLALGSLDLSHLLVDDRCVLVGRTEQPLVQFQIRQGAEEQNGASTPEFQSRAFTPELQSRAFTPEGQVVSYVRLVLPVRSTRLE
ncbi:hypothetical protein FYK55_09245 [Roseiconus nitratireducens]|uniref:Uncharacterized protein n=1 Tax=Roseiconus nitratireducens TaxID=2605748 RepID=A0A5M6DAB6_9BACT|nr:hypothetical protein [Roseiconus nitratireducens]KAA5544504.1 hypothetical protein FYK55_09245 [Roseiconus nitratireducens]